MTVEEMSDAINAELDARGIRRRVLRSAERVAGRAAVSEQVRCATMHGPFARLAEIRQMPPSRK